MNSSSCLCAYFLHCKIWLLCASVIIIRNLGTNKKKRLNERKINQEHERSKQFEDYNWIELLKSGSLPKLRVWQLDKYLEHFMLSSAKKFKMQQNLWFIQKHIVSNNNIEQNEVTTSQNQVYKELSLFSRPPFPATHPPKMYKEV